MAMQYGRVEKRTAAAVAVMLPSPGFAVPTELTLTENVSGRGARVVTKGLWRSNDSLVIKSLEGIPHPLVTFGIEGQFEGGLFADIIILHFINSMVMEVPESQRFKAAMWFLLKNEQTYFFVCEEAGIDTARLRDHLLVASIVMLIDQCGKQTGV
jgi:hypothetical protein